MTDENGKSYTNDPLVIYTGATAHKMFENELRNSVTVIGIAPGKDAYELGATGIDPYFGARFTFSDVRIEWDGYRRKAWYELHKNYKKEVTLSTPDGKCKCEMGIHCSKENEDNYSVSLHINYLGQDFYGCGKDCTWADAFADLQKRLPDDVKIMCCMTCRHGNMCPTGGTPEELFCTKDVVILRKSDLFFYTEDKTERENRSRDCTDVCEDYREQTKEYYTYNDYAYAQKSE